jgi:hypothetical protein
LVSWREESWLFCSIARNGPGNPGPFLLSSPGITPDRCVTILGLSAAHRACTIRYGPLNIPGCTKSRPEPGDAPIGPLSGRSLSLFSLITHRRPRSAPIRPLSSPNDAGSGSSDDQRTIRRIRALQRRGQPSARRPGWQVRTLSDVASSILLLEHSIKHLKPGSLPSLSQSSEGRLSNTSRPKNDGQAWDSGGRKGN